MTNWVLRYMEDIAEDDYKGVIERFRDSVDNDPAAAIEHFASDVFFVTAKKELLSTVIAEIGDCEDKETALNKAIESLTNICLHLVWWNSWSTSATANLRKQMTLKAAAELIEHLDVFRRSRRSSQQADGEA